MSDKIRVLIADDVEDTRKNIRTLLEFEERIEVIGEARDGEEALNLTEELKPNIILMDINMPVIDGLRATEKITLKYPEIIVIMMSVQGEREYFKKAMNCGAKEYLVKPFSIDTLIDTITRTFDKEQDRKRYLESINQKNEVQKDPKVITIFSTKGGVGKTTIAVNAAISIAKETGEKVALIDLDLQFGDVAVMLNISPTKTIIDMVEEISHLNGEILDEYMIEYMKGIKVLAAPVKPEYAEYIIPSHIEKIIEVLKKDYQYIIIDSVSNFSEVMLTALDNSDMILFVSTMNLPTIKNVKLGLDIMNSLHYSDEKIKIVVNKISRHSGIKIQDIEETIDKKVSICIPEDNRTVIPSVNKGYPFMRSRGESRISRRIKELTELLVTGKEVEYGKRLFNGFFSQKELRVKTSI